MRPERVGTVVSDIVDALRYSTPLALVAGVVWYLVASWSGEPNWVEGAVFVVGFGVVATLGWHYSDERNE
ncbi:hypothetical protein C5C07_14435 [Haloferax sp. Atlit-4N]|uniref:Uncharacterized protein n=1 Tax=Haloferax gibbonsii TaxID=35746 RepID=A0A0K1IUC2_HALGI|nr:hypothetical protein ABY42_09240 [Haloferax gibbonsii]QOS12996.1 uncharacterized protein HfgLR_14340 [Haloferax gibbonsii]RDZ52948.1 hypothetical protein C5C07_14435 [Haloferax sp. Atlit-4N]